MKPYWRVVTLWLSVYFVSGFAPQVDGTWFYAVQGLWSVGLILAIPYADNSKLSYNICLLEYLHIVNHFVGCFGYMMGISGVYSVYPVILISINAAEGFMLLHGAPWNGIFNRFFALWRVVGGWFSACYRALQNPIGKGI